MHTPSGLLPNSTEGDKSSKKISESAFRNRENSLLIVSSELEQGRPFLSQTLEIDDFVVGGAGLPALPDHPDPFESQSADSGVMLFAFVGRERRERELIADFQLPIVDLIRAAASTQPLGIVRLTAASRQNG
jgi:hypothetical protein